MSLATIPPTKKPLSYAAIDLWWSIRYSKPWGAKPTFKPPYEIHCDGEVFPLGTLAELVDQGLVEFCTKYPPYGYVLKGGS